MADGHAVLQVLVVVQHIVDVLGEGLLFGVEHRVDDGLGRLHFILILILQHSAHIYLSLINTEAGHLMAAQIVVLIKI